MDFMDCFAGLYEKDTWSEVESWQKFIFYIGLLFFPFTILTVVDFFL